MQKAGYNLHKVTKLAKICLRWENFPKSSRWLQRSGKSYKKQEKGYTSFIKQEKSPKVIKSLKKLLKVENEAKAAKSNKKTRL